MTCPNCDRPLIPADEGSRRVFVCLSCQYVADPMAVREDYDREAELVTAIERDLTGAGYIVERVGQHRADKAGTTEGVSDLLVSHPKWISWLSMQMEVKLPKGDVSDAQKRKYEAGRLAIVRSVKEARLSVDALHKRLQRAGLASE